MNEMIERVARAIYASRGSTVPWKDVNSWTEGEMRDYARAAIEAMREPTEAMLVAGDRIAIADAQRAEADNCLRVTDVGPVWRAMIEEALK